MKAFESDNFEIYMTEKLDKMSEKQIYEIKKRLMYLKGILF